MLLHSNESAKTTLSSANQSTAAWVMLDRPSNGLVVWRRC